MGDLFKDMLSSEESLFKNEVALNFDYQPKLIPFREIHQKTIASCIKPLFQKRNGKNIFIHGMPGVGKTVACKHVLDELPETTDEIIPIYINCWQQNTTYKILLKICDKFDYKLVQNKKTEELFKIIKEALNKKQTVFVFDEIDKMEDFDFLYGILEDIYRKTIILITNYKEWLLTLEQRIRSRLTPATLEFKPYNEKETKEILRQRLEYAFVPNVFEDNAFNLIANKTYELKDLRCGLHLMKESALIAEDKSSRKITPEHAKESLTKLDEFSVKKDSELDSDMRFILQLIKKNNGSRIGNLHKIYKEAGGESAYRTYQRKISKLEEDKFITVSKTEGGKLGNTSIINFGSNIKKLTEF